MIWNSNLQYNVVIVQYNITQACWAGARNQLSESLTDGSPTSSDLTPRALSGTFNRPLCLAFAMSKGWFLLCSPACFRHLCIQRLILMGVGPLFQGKRMQALMTWCHQHQHCSLFWNFPRRNYASRYLARLTCGHIWAHVGSLDVHRQ